MVKVLVACGCGMGSSQIIKMKAEEVLKKLQIECSIYHTSIDEAKSISGEYDLIIISEAFVKNFKVKNNKTIVVGLKNLMSKKEMEEKILACGIVNN